MWGFVESTLVLLFAVGMIGLTVRALISAGIGTRNATVVERARGIVERLATRLRPQTGRIGIAVAVIATFVFWTQAGDFLSSRSSERTGYAALTPDAAAYHDASLGTTNMPFLSFVRETLGEDQTYAIAPKTSLDDVFTRQWSTYVLTPKLLVDEHEADLLVIFAPDPTLVEYDRERFPQLEIFAPGYSIARRSE